MKTDLPFQNHNVVLPIPPDAVPAMRNEMEIYARFMRHLRDVPTRRMEIKILSAIQFTADIMDRSDAEIARALVELGLRAPRLSFPAEFLKHADMTLSRKAWEIGAPSAAMRDLHDLWQKTGESQMFEIMVGNLFRRAEVAV